MLETRKAFTALSEEFVECLMRDEPVLATAAGIHDYDERLPDDTPDGFAARVAWLRDLEQRLVTAVPWEELPVEQRVDWALMRSRLATLRGDLEEIKVQHRDPVRWPENALRSVFLLMSRPFAPLDERKEAVLARLMAIPDYLASARENLDRVPALFVQIAHEVNDEGPGYVDEVVRALIRAFPGEGERIEHAGSRARVGFAQYREFLERDVAPKAQESFALGERWMNYRLEREHLLDWDCARLEAFGREHLERVRGLLDAEAKRIDPAKGWREQIALARRRHPEPLRLREAYVAEVERARRFVLERRLAPVPEGRLEVVDTPSFERMLQPYAWSLAPAPFDVEPTGLFFVTPTDLSWRAEEQEDQVGGHAYAALPLVTAHETWPGHLLQRLHANRAGSRLRQLADSSLMIEGWALYCEELMHEHGFLVDPVSRLWQLKDLAWRACRVVIDARLHAGRMSVEEAAQMLVDEAMVDRRRALAEVRRWALDPTHAMSFLVGREQLLDLRAEAKQRLGARFDLMQFHGALLAGGSLPPTLLREELWTRLGA